MHLKSIVLDGFKSYGQRTEIHGFDREFNAITGLNGTGKSNILDAICFVLGITNLSHVRVGSLQDLIYKSGQAGINKATVSVTFDNKDKANSPIGFEDYHEIVVTRQVILGGKNKYLINGSNVPNKKVHDMFCSVQLNVNNPHFLIMQGRITKVLNMKPPEILSMLEEAAGTRMYEAKRQTASKELEKKDAKLRELNDLLKEEVIPNLEKLKQERAVYLEFQRIERELKYLSGLFLAWQYIIYQKQVARCTDALTCAEKTEKEYHDKIANNKATISELDSKMEEVQQRISSENSNELAALEEQLKEKTKLEAKANATEKAAKDNIAAEEKKKKQLEKNLRDDQAALVQKEGELSNVSEVFEQLKNDDARDNEAFQVAKKRYEAVSSGMDVNEKGETATLQEQLMAAKQEATEANTEMKNATMQLTHFQQQLKLKQKDLGTGTTDYKEDKIALESKTKEAKMLETSLSRMNFSEEKLHDCQGRRKQLTHEMRAIREKVDRFEARYPFTEFHYTDPEPNFNRRSVKGVVCNLISVVDENYIMALETGAGGRLYNIIVDMDRTSKKLLERGNLQQRVTFIPLNQIRGDRIDPRTVKLAQDLVGKENVKPALSLIEYSKEIQPAMDYIFGGFFVCRDINIAKKITFHPEIMRRCVTLDGDVVDPSGTLSGGAVQKSTPVLSLLVDINQRREQLSSYDKELQSIEQSVQQMSKEQEAWTTKKQQLEIKQHEIGLIQKRLQQTSYHQLQEEIAGLRQGITEMTEKVETCKKIHAEKTAAAKDLEIKMKDIKGYREKMLKESESEMKRLKKKAEESRKLWQKREQDYETLNLEIKELREEVVKLQEQIVSTETALVKAKEDFENLQTSGGEMKETVAALQKSLKEKKHAITEKNKEINKMSKQKESLKEEISEIELELKKQAHATKKLQDELDSAKGLEREFRKKVKDDEKSIQEASKMTDKEGEDLRKKISNATETRTKLSRTVNTKAQSLFEQEEKQYESLVKRRQVVETDKKKIVEVMNEMDKKKKEALKMAHVQVSKDFGSIFSTLLPGTSAKLVPPQGQSVLEGLEVKVAFSGIWKESLSELSGGQRSLVALSLILAMLLFKPAPLYILDEVDAALDLSHTQNVGQMLKAHFKHSQFIIVSLKDGMFSNANVLFRTKFVDGMSAVTRTTNQGGHIVTVSANTEDERVNKKKKIY